MPGVHFGSPRDIQNPDNSIDKSKFSKEQWAKLVLLYDKNKDGNINRSDFGSGFSPYAGAEFASAVGAAYNMYVNDKNKDGRLTFEENYKGQLSDAQFKTLTDKFNIDPTNDIILNSALIDRFNKAKRGLEALDEDRDGKLTKKDIENTFKYYDTDHNGSLSKQERAAFKQLTGFILPDPGLFSKFKFDDFAKIAEQIAHATGFQIV